jgi:hypothetical protein
MKLLREGVVEVCAGAAGASFVAITQVATRDSINVVQSVAIGCFSITLPIFTVAALSRPLREVELRSCWSKIIFLLLVVGGFAFVLGIASILWSFGWCYVIVFVLSTSVFFYAVTKTI